MGEFGRGAKAGVVSGAIYGVVNAVVVTGLVMGVLLPALFPDLFSATGGALGAVVLVVMLLAGIIGGVIGGLIFGLIFAAAYGILPGKTSVIKGVVLSFAFWVIFGFGIQFILSSGWGAEARVYVVLPIAVNLGTSIIWGWLLGSMWDRFGR